MIALKEHVSSDRQSKGYQVLGLGTPIVDYLVAVSDEYVNSLSGVRGGSSLVDDSIIEKVISDHSSSGLYVTGGSAANTIKGLTQLGHSCALIGKIGHDEAGKKISEDLKSCGITPHLSFSQLKTAQAACLITPDNERTMRTLIGAGAEISEKDLRPEYFKNIDLVHIEGYLMDRCGVVQKAMQLAKEAGAKVSFDLSSLEIVKEYKKPISRLLSSFVDIVFANEEEAMTLTGLAAEKACLLLKDLSSIAIVKIGNRGCLAATRTKHAFYQAFPVTVVDTTGAGDLFASGFLHGFLTHKSLEESLRFGNLIASEVIQNIGAEIPKNHWAEIRRNL